MSALENNRDWRRRRRKCRCITCECDTATRACPDRLVADLKIDRNRCIECGLIDDREVCQCGVC